MNVTLKLPKTLVLEAKRYAKKEKKTYREVVETALAIYIKKEITDHPHFSRMKGLQVKNPLLS